MGARIDPGLAAFTAARERIRTLVLHSPLLRLQVGARNDIYLKCENLQAVGSFKIRCGANALLRRRDLVAGGVFTASAGNFAQGLAYAGRAMGCPVTTYVPETAALSKVEALKRLDARVIAIPYEEWWAMLAQPTDDPCFIHPVTDPDVLAGNGTIGLEILEDMPDAATILAPYGGGGLSVGLAAALRAAGSTARVVACETEAGTPLTAARAAGGPVTVDFNPRTFITGMGGPAVLLSMWPLVRDFLSGTAVVSLAQVADAIRLLVERHHLVVEGAGGATLAAALDGDFPGPVVCILSGGHLDPAHLVSILKGKVP